MREIVQKKRLKLCPNMENRKVNKLCLTKCKTQPGNSAENCKNLQKTKTTLKITLFFFSPQTHEEQED